MTTWERIGARVAHALGIIGWPFPWEAGESPGDEHVLGAGAFGAVYPTLHYRWVVKITEDDSEGPIWTRIAHDGLLRELAGFPRVLGVWATGGVYDYAILREALTPRLLPPGQRRDLLNAIGFYATELMLEHWEHAVNRLGRMPNMKDCAVAMLAFRERTGELLTDIHAGNLGVRAGSHSFVIFDVGGATDYNFGDDIPIANRSW